MVVDPLELLTLGSPYRLNDLYYINKLIIPALQRAFGLVGANLKKWFLEMPRSVWEAFSRRPLFTSNPHRTRIDYQCLSKHCIVCGELVDASMHLCKQCSQNKTAAVTAIIGRTSRLERGRCTILLLYDIVALGTGLWKGGVKCTSLACLVFYERCNDMNPVKN